MNAPTTQPPNFDKRVGQYVQVRDKINALKEKHKEELLPWGELLDQLNTEIVGHLNTVGADSVSTAHGTAYKTEKKSVSIADMTAFWTYVVSQGDFDLIDKRANVTAVEAYINRRVEEAQSDPSIIPGPPPGVNFSSRYVAGVRRK